MYFDSDKTIITQPKTRFAEKSSEKRTIFKTVFFQKNV